MPSKITQDGALRLATSYSASIVFSDSPIFYFITSATVATKQFARASFAIYKESKVLPVPLAP